MLLSTSYPNDIDITTMKKPNTSSNFRSPYLSSIKKDKVSMTVISTPTQSGILSKLLVFFSC